MNRIGRKRLGHDIPMAIFERLKKSAAERNITFTRLLLKIFAEFLRKEEKNNS